MDGHLAIHVAHKTSVRLERLRRGRERGRGRRRGAERGVKCLPGAGGWISLGGGGMIHIAHGTDTSTTGMGHVVLPW